jgi:hypothetical protein
MCSLLMSRRWMMEKEWTSLLLPLVEKGILPWSNKGPEWRRGNHGQTASSTKVAECYQQNLDTMPTNPNNAAPIVRSIFSVGGYGGWSWLIMIQLVTVTAGGALGTLSSLDHSRDHWLADGLYNFLDKANAYLFDCYQNQYSSRCEEWRITQV